MPIEKHVTAPTAKMMPDSYMMGADEAADGSALMPVTREKTIA